MPLDLDWVASLPPALQFALLIGIGIGAILLGKSGYASGKREPPITSKDMVLTAAGITDMEPVRKCAAELARVADELGTIRQILAEDAEDRQGHRTWREGFEAGQGGQTVPPRRR